MPHQPRATEQEEPSAEISDLPPDGGRRSGKLLLLLVSIALSVLLFLVLDFIRSAAIRRSANANLKLSSCTVQDPVRHHAFRPNCHSIQQWGGDWYEFYTNSLGFRDDRIREVPLTDPKPRILLLGDSFTEGKIAWRDSFAGRITVHFPQYDFLNGGTYSYAPSNYLNVGRKVLAAGVDIDEVIVFIDLSDVQDEAAYYRDVDASGAVAGPLRGQRWVMSPYASWRIRIAKYLMLTNSVIGFFERWVISHGYFHLPTAALGDTFDMERSAWTYRKVNETDPSYRGYAPLGMEGGIAKEKAKMDLLWQELAKRNIPISVVVYPYPAQLVHDSVGSRQVRMWREWCDGTCKRFVSVFPEFFAVKEQCPKGQPGCWYPKLFLFGDMHYSAGGNALVADAVIQNLTQEPPVKHQP